MRYIGCCNLPAWLVAKANGYAGKKGWTPFVSSQNYYSIAGRDVERELVPMVDLKLSDEHLSELDQVSAIAKEYPAWMVDMINTYRPASLINKKFV